MWSAYQRWLLTVVLLLSGLAILLVTNGVLNPTAGAFSAGPPPGYTRAPGEEPEACAECHLSPGSSGSGQISITVPPTYVPGQTYQITVTHTNSDPTRRRWGFQLTALDPSDEKAGELQNLNSLTQIITGGPGGNRQYIEHNSAGTFQGQQFGASWTFNWTAPSTNVGTVTFYVAGNHANNDGNSSGDYIYFSFATSQGASSPPQLRLEQGASDPNQVAAVESVVMLRDPFRVQASAVSFYPANDQNTRVMVFAANVVLNPGETSSAVTVDLTDALNQSFNDIAAEDVRPVANTDFSQVVFRLPTGLAQGRCSVKIRLHELTSNTGTFRIVP